eukprot:361840-Chlamydomonas_euryale.AAC.1
MTGLICRCSCFLHVTCNAAYACAWCRPGGKPRAGAPKCVPLVMRHGTKIAKIRVPPIAPNPSSS